MIDGHSPCAETPWSIPPAGSFDVFSKMHKAVRMLRVTDFRIGRWPCPACGYRIQLRLNADEMGVRCMRCGASPVTQSIVDVIRRECMNLASFSVYELSSRGTLVEWLRPRVGVLTTSEYMPDVPLGVSSGGVRCEDVQRLTFGNAVFDLCTSTEVFEHVKDDHAGFSQIWRVLRKGGVFIFTVPLSGAEHTVERAGWVDGEWVHFLEPEYHGDPFSEDCRVLCVRDYGRDIVKRLLDAGFATAGLVMPEHDMMQYARAVVVARKQG